MTQTKEKQARFQDYSYLPDSLLIEILVRLPFKSIFKLKIVCKQWCSLISDPLFAHCYVSRINNDSLLSPLRPPWTLLINNDKKLERTGFPVAAVNEYPDGFISSGFLPFLSTWISVVASHNGMLLCYQMLSDVYFSICNPFTKQHITLPKPPSCDVLGSWAAGFISQDDGNYKVVRIIQGKDRLKLEVFTSQTGTWIFFYHSLCPAVRSTPVTYNDILHWIGFDSAEKIVAYDPYKDIHQVRLIDPPSNIEDSYSSGRLAVCGGKLCCFQCTENESWSLKLWVLTNYETGEWQLKHKTGFSELMIQLFGKGLSLSLSRIPLAMHPFDVDKVYFRSEGSLVSYNFQTQEAEVVRSDAHSVRVHAFIFPPWPIPIAQPSW